MMLPRLPRGQAKSRAGVDRWTSCFARRWGRCWPSHGSTRPACSASSAGTSRCRACGRRPMPPATTRPASATRSARRSPPGRSRICARCWRATPAARRRRRRRAIRLGDVAVRRCAGRRRPAAGPPASRRRDPPSGDARFVLSAAVSDPAAVGALGDRPAGRCRARSRAGDRPARQPLRCCRRRRHRRRFAAGDERWLARVLAARADARRRGCVSGQAVKTFMRA